MKSNETTNELLTRITRTTRVINYTHHTNEIVIANDETIRPRDFPNVNYENNAALTEFLNCSLYATIWFETLDTFTPLAHAEHPHTEAFMHHRQ